MAEDDEGEGHMWTMPGIWTSQQMDGQVGVEFDFEAFLNQEGTPSTCSTLHTALRFHILISPSAVSGREHLALHAHPPVALAEPGWLEGGRGKLKP